MSDDRTCTCHPDDDPPRPCPRRYALQECREAELARLRAELAAVTAERDELVMAVASKFPGESRHATALRYIREREAQTPECAQEARDD